MIAYFNGRFMPRQDICIPVDDRGFLFSDSLYEVIRHYPGGLFRADAHIRRLRRMNHGARHLASELMVTGTTLEITPILSLDGRPIGDGLPGPTARTLQAAFTERISF